MCFPKGRSFLCSLKVTVIKQLTENIAPNKYTPYPCQCSGIPEQPKLIGFGECFSPNLENVSPQILKESSTFLTPTLCCMNAFHFKIIEMTSIQGHRYGVGLRGVTPHLEKFHSKIEEFLWHLWVLSRSYFKLVLELRMTHHICWQTGPVNPL